MLCCKNQYDSRSSKVDRVANKRLAEDNTKVIQRCFILDEVTVKCFVEQNIAVHFEFQKHIYFRNGYIVIGKVMSCLEGQNMTDYQQNV
jgi:hypothetical protein